jgi:hypothetical protein
LILISCNYTQYHPADYAGAKELTLYSNLSDSETALITKDLYDDLGVKVTALKEWHGSNGSPQEILHEIMKLPDKGKILVLIDKAMWHCWILPCVFGATETISWDRAYATGYWSAMHEARHLFGAKDIL